MLFRSKRRRESIKSVPSGSAGSSQEDSNPKFQRQQAAQKRRELAEQTRPWRKELSLIEEQLSRQSHERDDLLALAERPQDIQDMADWGRRCKSLTESIDRLEERWLTLSELIQIADSQAS